jgi:hypothetical protein
MLANAATNMLVMRTVRGRVPALLSTNVAIRFAMSYLDSAAAIVKPPRRSMITGVHMAPNMKFAACLAGSLACGLTSEQTTLRTTQRKGIINAVTNKGMTFD